MYLFSQLPVVDAVVSHNRRKELNLNLYPSRFFFSLVRQLRNSNVSAIMRCLKKKILKLGSPLPSLYFQSHGRLRKKLHNFCRQLMLCQFQGLASKLLRNDFFSPPSLMDVELTNKYCIFLRCIRCWFNIHGHYEIITPSC